jgi:hypothetical protein
MESIYVVTLWSGGRAAKKWHTKGKPSLMASGNGVEFQCLDTKLPVQVLGHISVEEYESGKEELEAILGADAPRRADAPPPRESPPTPAADAPRGNIEPLF